MRCQRGDPPSEMVRSARARAERCWAWWECVTRRGNFRKMGRIAGLLVIPLVSVASIAAASPRPGTIATGIPIEGTVVGTSAHWTDDGSRIVTESTVRTDHGDVVVSQLGGHVDGITMRSFPSAPALEL